MSGTVQICGADVACCAKLAVTAKPAGKTVSQLAASAATTRATTARAHAVDIKPGPVAISLRCSGHRRHMPTLYDRRLRGRRRHEQVVAAGGGDLERTLGAWGAAPPASTCLSQAKA